MRTCARYRLPTGCAPRRRAERRARWAAEEAAQPAGSRAAAGAELHEQYGGAQEGAMPEDPAAWHAAVSEEGSSGARAGVADATHGDTEALASSGTISHLLVD